ncbi:MAG: hypothetical protein ACFFB0_15835 [Promethearchaeota archaeon]
MKRNLTSVCNKFQKKKYHRKCVDKEIWSTLEKYITLRINGSLGRSP